jgi:hypothetical protein
MAEDREIRLKVVRKPARRRVAGAHKKQVDTVKNWFATDEQGRVEDLIRKMIRDPDAPLEGYGGSRDNVRLTSLAAAKGCIEDHGGELSWGFRDGCGRLYPSSRARSCSFTSPGSALPPVFCMTWPTRKLMAPSSPAA